MIEVLSCGPVTSIQDNGRHGYRHLGVCQAGVADTISARQANLLLANAPDAAVLELFFAPLQLLFTKTFDIVLSGTDYQARLLDPAGNVVPGCVLPGYVYTVPAGHSLRLARPPASGLFACLAVGGGFDVPAVLGSRSTDMGAGFGGHQGRMLRGGDRLCVSSRQIHPPAGGPGVRPLQASNILRAIAGPEYELFRPQSRVDLWQSDWKVHKDSNRMGTRLTGDSLLREWHDELPSSAVLPGVIQVPGDGKPIILGVDAQTTGGYPRIASVIRADIRQLCYLRPGDTVHLQQVTVERAQQLGLDMDNHLTQLQHKLGQGRPGHHADNH